MATQSKQETLNTAPENPMAPPAEETGEQATQPKQPAKQAKDEKAPPKKSESKAKPEEKPPQKKPAGTHPNAPVEDEADIPAKQPLLGDACPRKGCPGFLRELNRYRGERFVTIYAVCGTCGKAPNPNKIVKRL